MEKLIKQILSKINTSDILNQDEIFMLCGHAPIDYSNKKIDWEKWGDFSEITIDLASQVSKYLPGKIKFLFLIDDKPTSLVSRYIKSSDCSKIRDEIYTSGTEIKILEMLCKKYNISKENIVLQSSHKAKRHNNVFHSELLIANNNTGNLCADAYISLYEQYANNGAIISFIPRVCKGNICEIGFTHYDFQLKNCSIFLETGNTKKEMLETVKIVIS